jgi:hypothetical protein
VTYDVFHCSGCPEYRLEQVKISKGQHADYEDRPIWMLPAPKPEL